MKRLALVLIWAAWAASPSPASAFELDTRSGANADGAARFLDPDDQPMPGLQEVAPDVQDYQGSANNPQLTPDQAGWIFSVAPQH